MLIVRNSFGNRGSMTNKAISSWTNWMSHLWFFLLVAATLGEFRGCWGRGDNYEVCIYCCRFTYKINTIWIWSVGGKRWSTDYITESMWTGNYSATTYPWKMKLYLILCLGQNAVHKALDDDNAGVITSIANTVDDSSKLYILRRSCLDSKAEHSSWRTY